MDDVVDALQSILDNPLDTALLVGNSFVDRMRQSNGFPEDTIRNNMDSSVLANQLSEAMGLSEEYGGGVFTAASGRLIEHYMNNPNFWRHLKDLNPTTTYVDILANEVANI